MTLALFLILKISAVKEYIPWVLYSIDSRMFYEIYKGYQTRKNKKQTENAGCLRRSLVIMEILLEL
jgi:hypothetical protein